MSCAACFQGMERTDAQPTGQTTKLHGLDCYVASPPNGRASQGIIVIVPDAFGWDFVNNRLLADEYARQGSFTVYLPDVMGGEYHPSLTPSHHSVQSSSAGPVGKLSRIQQF